MIDENHVRTEPPELEIRLVDASTRPVVERLLQLYIHDLSEFRGSRIDASGRFAQADRCASYFTDEDRCAYLFVLDEQPVGFALIGGLTSGTLTVGEFFVVRSARRGGIGRAGARGIFERHQGRWEWAFQEVNAPAAKLWRSMATELVGDAWIEDRRPVPDKPHIPDDVWITLNTSKR